MMLTVKQEIDGRTSIIAYFPRLLTETPELAEATATLMATPDNRWIQGRGIGKNKTPRLVRWYSEAGGAYKFSGEIYQSFEYEDSLVALQARVVELLKEKLTDRSNNVAFYWEKVNSVLVNKYRCAQDSVSAHSDNEPEFGQQPTIISVSTGATRSFKVRRMTENVREKEWKKTGRPWVPNPEFKSDRFAFELEHGDVLVMAGATQDFWVHEIPKEKKRECDVRLNLTFRPYLLGEEQLQLLQLKFEKQEERKRKREREGPGGGEGGGQGSGKKKKKKRRRKGGKKKETKVTINIQE